MHLIISTDLSPNSKTIVLAENALSVFNEMNVEAELIDLAENDLPFCDGKICYENQAVQELTEIITTADSLIVVSPIYNYLNSTIKCNSNTVCKESGAAVGSPLFFRTKMRCINETLQPAHAGTKIRNLYIA